MQQISVRNFMRECSAVLVSESTTLRAAAEVLIQHDCPVLMTHDADDRLTGIVAETAVIRRLMATVDPNETVASIQSRHVESVAESAELRNVLHLFRAACHVIVPVVDADRRVVGMLHRNDIVRLLLSDSMVADASHGDATGRPHFMDRREQTQAQHDSDPEQNGDATPA